jgi:hypothetical protein
MFIKIGKSFTCPKCGYLNICSGRFCDEKEEGIAEEKMGCIHCNWREGQKDNSVGVKEVKQVIRKRERIYWNIIIFDMVKKSKIYMQFRNKDLKFLDELKKRGEAEHFKVIKDYITKGWEIVKEETKRLNCK